jgi:hypothetical protein
MVRLLLFHQPPANALEACHHENLGLRCGCWIRKTSTIDPSVAQADLNINRDSATHHEDRYGIHSDEALEAADRCGAAGQAVNVIDWKLATTLPTTLAGIAAVLRFANEHEDAGGEWPNTDAVGPDGWHYQLRATMAAAIEALIKAPAGKVVSARNSRPKTRSTPV